MKTPILDRKYLLEEHFYSDGSLKSEKYMLHMAYISFYYSEDGTTPKIDADYLYESPFEITDTATIKAVAVFEGVRSSYITVTIKRETLPLEEAIEVPDIITIRTDSSVPWRSGRRHSR